MRYSRFIGITLLAVSLIWIPSAEGQGSIPSCVACQQLDMAKAPKYKIGRRFERTKAGLIVYVSIRKQQFTPADLAALACRLDRDFKKEGNVLVLVFDNPKSAKRYVPRFYQEKPAGWEENEKAQRAIYIRAPAEGENSIAWYLDTLHKTGEISRSLCSVPDSAVKKAPSP